MQTDFVDSPAAAVADADELVNAVMSERGYPMDDFEQRVADISVDHAAVVDNYRSAHRVFVAMGQGAVSTEQERQAMQQYRLLLEELLADSRTDVRGLPSSGGLFRANERTGTRV